MTIDLVHNVIPVTAAADKLTHLIDRARQDETPIILTRNGRSVGALLAITHYVALHEELAVTRNTLMTMKRAISAMLEGDPEATCRVRQWVTTEAPLAAHPGGSSDALEYPDCDLPRFGSQARQR